MHVVVTGSSGSLAEGLIAVALASTTHTLTLVDHRPPPDNQRISNPRIKYETLDLRDYASFAQVIKGADGLIHLAAYAQPYLSTPDVIHNTNVTLSFNALQAAADAGVRYVVLASSVNAIGGAYSQDRNIKYEYFPVDEQHPYFTDEPYALSKQIAEIQAIAFSRAYPNMTISCFRFHHVVPTKKCMQGPESIRKNSRDLWGWTESGAAGRACLLALEADWTGAEIFYAIGEEHCVPGGNAEAMAKEFFPSAALRTRLEPGQGFFDCSKVERMLGWKHVGGRQPR